MKPKLIAMLPWKYIALALAAALSFGSTAKADVNYDTMQLDFLYNPVTGTTTASYSGHPDATDQHYLENEYTATADSWYITPDSFIAVSTGQSHLGVIAGNNYGFSPDYGNSIAYPWGVDGSTLNATAHTGDPFGFGNDYIILPANYGSDLITGSVTWALNLEQMGFDHQEIAAGGGSYTGSAGTLNWTVGTTAVPEPSSYAMWGGVLVFGVVLLRRRRRRRLV